MKPLIFTISLICSIIIFADETPVTSWGKQYGFALEALSITADQSGNCFIAGTTGDSLSPAYAGKKDVFVRKFDPAGNILWTKNIGSNNDDYCYAAATDLDGNCFIAGKTLGNIGEENFGDNDAFVVKLNPSGDIIWKKQFGTTKSDDLAHAIVDNQGNCFVSGSTNGDFDGTIAGGSDAILVKFNSEGDILWKKQYGTSANDKAEYIGLDKNNFSYCLLSNKEIIKYDQQGNFFGKNKHTIYIAKGIVIDDSLNIYIGGTNGISNGSKAILIKYNKDWVKQWERTFGSGPWTGVNSMVKFKDGTEDILIGVCQNYPSCMGVCRRYDHDGNVKWIYTLQKTGVSSVCGHNSAIDGNGNCYLSGFTDGSLFDKKVNAQEMFLSKIIFSSQTDVEDQNIIPEDLKLNQNFPNPFNPSTTIIYSLEKPSLVKLTIYDVSGQEIKMLRNDFQNSGDYSMVWDAKDGNNNVVSSGIYFYILETEKAILQKKMVLVK